MLWSIFNVFVQAPYLIVLPLAIVAWLRWRRATIVTNIAVALWGLYLIWEFTIWLGFGCDPDCDIRVDLIVVAPLLIAVTLFAAWSAFRPINPADRGCSDGAFVWPSRLPRPPWPSSVSKSTP